MWHPRSGEHRVQLADVLGCDLAAAARQKLDIAEVRFPAAEVRGVAPLK